MMTRRFRTSLLIVTALALAASVSAQEGHPLVGTWYGDYGPTTGRRDLTVIMKWDGKTVTGSVNPGPAASPLTSVTMTITPGKPAAEGRDSTTGTPPIFDVRFEFGGNVFVGTIQNPVAGNRRITGTWTRGSETGPFQIRRL